jgi:hypothetical protein
MCRETISWASSLSLINQCVLEDVYQLHRIFTLIPSVARRPLPRVPQFVPPVPKANHFVSLLSDGM